MTNQKCETCGKKIDYLEGLVYDKKIECFECYLDGLSYRNKLDGILRRKNIKNKIEIGIILFMFLTIFGLLIHNLVR